MFLTLFKNIFLLNKAKFCIINNVSVAINGEVFAPKALLHSVTTKRSKYWD